MDVNVIVWLLVLVVMLTLNRCTSQRNNQFPSVVMAMCQAKCYDTYGLKQEHSRDEYDYYDDVDDVDDDKRDKFSQKTCIKKNCKKCLGACNITYTNDAECRIFCNTSQSCLRSCSFLKKIQNNSTPIYAGIHHSISRSLIRPPEIVCTNAPYHGKNCGRKVASVYLKWDIKKPAVSKSLLFLISVRETKNKTKNQSNWKCIKVVPYSFTEVVELSCDTWYQFRVTVVTAEGVQGPELETKWTKTPGDNYEPILPLSMQLEQQNILNQKPAATISWDPGENGSCYFRIFWMSGTDSVSEDEIKAPRQFRYKITQLDFSTNYTVRLYSYDDRLAHSTPKSSRLSFITPSCLQSTAYNHTVCAPMSPRNLTLHILTPSHESEDVKYVNISLRWVPPLHTHNGSDFLRYILEYRKDPPINEASRIQPHSGSETIDNMKQEVILTNVHNHNKYSFSLRAESIGGKGDKVKISGFIATTNSTLGNMSFTDVINSSKAGVLPQDLMELWDYNDKEDSGWLGQPDYENAIADADTDSTAMKTKVLTTVELVAIVMVPVLLIITLFCIIFIIMLRKRKAYKPYTSPPRFGPVEELNPIYEGIPRSPPEETKYITEDDYELDYSCLDFISVIGEGAFGKVVKAEYYQNPNDRNTNTCKIVAVKMLKDFYTGDESRNFMLEIQAMKNLGHHPFIVSIIGCCLSGPKLCLVMDFCALGDLRNYLRKYREKIMYNMPSNYGMMSALPDCRLSSQLLNTTSTVSTMLNTSSTVSRSSLTSDNIALDDKSEVSEGQLLSYGRQITLGMEFLEQRKFIHRDLAARNILLYDHRHAKISDFGLTRDVYETNVYQPTSARKLPYKWMAIESLFSQRFTIKSDVWSFGIVLWEIVTFGGSPYPSIPLKDLYGLLNDGYRMEKPENCSAKLYKIMLSCWHPNPNNRPSFTQLKEEIEMLLEETQFYIDLSIEGDYFSESISGSHYPELQKTEEKLTNGNEEKTTTARSNEYVVAKNLFVDIHSEPKDIDAEEQDRLLPCDTNDTRKTGSQESFQLSDLKHGNKHDTEEEAKLLPKSNFNVKRESINGLDKDKSNNIETCDSNSYDITELRNMDNRSVHSDTISQGSISSRQKPKLKDSLRNILRGVTKSIPGSPKSSRISLNLNNMNGEKLTDTVSYV